MFYSFLTFSPLYFPGFLILFLFFFIFQYFGISIMCKWKFKLWWCKMGRLTYHARQGRSSDLYPVRQIRVPPAPRGGPISFVFREADLYVSHAPWGGPHVWFFFHPRGPDLRPWGAPPLEVLTASSRRLLAWLTFLLWPTFCLHFRLEEVTWIVSGW